MMVDLKKLLPVLKSLYKAESITIVSEHYTPPLFSGVSIRGVIVVKISKDKIYSILASLFNKKEWNTIVNFSKILIEIKGA